MLCISGVFRGNRRQPISLASILSGAVNLFYGRKKLSITRKLIEGRGKKPKYATKYICVVHEHKIDNNLILSSFEIRTVAVISCFS